MISGNEYAQLKYGTLHCCGAYDEDDQDGEDDEY
jgi:hypothetical protein